MHGTDPAEHHFHRTSKGRIMNFKTAVVFGVLTAAALSPLPILAQTSATPAKQGDAKSDPSGEMAQGEIQKIDKDTGRLTIKHGEIKSLGMPGMTMVFATKDKSMADKVKTGDRIRFKAVNENGKFIVTEIAQDK